MDQFGWSAPICTGKPRDVVYITRSPLQRWNDTINGLLPSVRGASVVEALGN